MFGIDTFVSSDEWDGAVGRLKAGEVAFVADARGVEHALFVDPAPADRAHGPMLVKVAGVGRTIGREDRPRRGTWFVDYCGDGVIDRVLRYGHEDEPTVLYYAAFAYAQPGVIATTAPLATTDFQYVQDLDQWSSRFGGNAFIAMFNYSYATESLVPMNEAPFCFYDGDGDGTANAALRLEIPLRYSWIRSRLLLARSLLDRAGVGRDVTTARYSLNLDEGADWGTPFHYNFSVSGIGRLQPPDSARAPMQIGSAVSEPLTSCAGARGAVQATEWSGLALTWKEDDLNHAENDPQQRDRWEGVINRGTAAFPQVGGPPARRFNTRTEIAEGPKSMRLYYSPIDRRIHLLGASTSSLDVDFDQDDRVDMRMEASDSNADGVLDRWQVDANADGVWDRTHVASDPGATMLEWDDRSLPTFYRAERDRAIADYESGIAALKRARGVDAPVPAEAYLLEKADDNDRIGQRLRVSPEARRFYLSVALEQHFQSLQRELASRGLDAAAAGELSELFGAGAYELLADRLDESGR